MKKILAIGGAVIKTARNELLKVIEKDMVEMLIFNGGAIFHDFQLSIDDTLKSHSYPIEKLIESFACNTRPSDLLWNWLWHTVKVPSEENIIHTIPEGSVVRLCYEKEIPVLMFTTPGADFWHLFNHEWSLLGDRAWMDMHRLTARFKEDKFHFVNVGSATMHPEIFIKCIAVAKPKDFVADVVDFLEMYRPRTRVAKYGTYYKMEHIKYFNALLTGEIN